MRIALSNRTYPMLKEFAENGGGYAMRTHEAQKFDQRPFRALLVHGWITFTPGRNGFQITQEGRAAWEAFQKTEIKRKNPTMPLTAYFDAAAYGLGPRKKKPRKARAKGEVVFLHTA